MHQNVELYAQFVRLSLGSGNWGKPLLFWNPLLRKATRKLHKPNTRLQDTTNEVLGRFQTSNPGSAASIQASAQQPAETRRAA